MGVSHRYLFSYPAASISVCSIRIHKDTQLGKVFSFLIFSIIFILFYFISNMIFVFLRFNKSNNSISMNINQMMYSMLCKGYSTYSVMTIHERELWFRNFAVISKF